MVWQNRSDPKIVALTSRIEGWTRDAKPHLVKFGKACIGGLGMMQIPSKASPTHKVVIRVAIFCSPLSFVHFACIVHPRFEILWAHHSLRGRFHTEKLASLFSVLCEIVIVAFLLHWCRWTIFGCMPGQDGNLREITTTSRPAWRACRAVVRFLECKFASPEVK